LRPSEAGVTPRRILRDAAVTFAALEQLVVLANERMVVERHHHADARGSRSAGQRFGPQERSVHVQDLGTGPRERGLHRARESGPFTLEREARDDSARRPRFDPEGAPSRRGREHLHALWRVGSERRQVQGDAIHGARIRHALSEKQDPDAGWASDRRGGVTLRAFW
jgi:hypothetical protein